MYLKYRQLCTKSRWIDWCPSWPLSFLAGQYLKMAKDLLFLWHFLLSLVELLVDMPDETFRASSSVLNSAPYLARLLTLDLFARSAFSEDSATGRECQHFRRYRKEDLCDSSASWGRRMSQVKYGVYLGSICTAVLIGWDPSPPPPPPSPLVGPVIGQPK